MSAAATAPIQPPLSRDEHARLSAAVTDFTHDQLLWASGFLAGLAASKTRAASIVAAPAADGAKAGRGLVVLYGSQTGNSKRVASSERKASHEWSVSWFYQ